MPASPPARAAGYTPADGVAYPSVYPLLTPWEYGPPIATELAFGYGWTGGWPSAWNGIFPRIRF